MAIKASQGHTGSVRTTQRRTRWELNWKHWGVGGFLEPAGRRRQDRDMAEPQSEEEDKPDLSRGEKDAVESASGSITPGLET